MLRNKKEVVIRRNEKQVVRKEYDSINQMI